MSTDNLALIRRYVQDFLGRNDVAVADELLAPDCLYDTAFSPNQPLRGPESAKRAIAALHAAFPDIRMEILDLFGTEDRVAVRFRATGTQTKEFFGIPPTGRVVPMIETHTYRLRDGKIVEDYAADNNYDLPYLLYPALKKAVLGENA